MYIIYLCNVACDHGTQMHKHGYLYIFLNNSLNIFHSGPAIFSYYRMGWYI